MTDVTIHTLQDRLAEAEAELDAAQRDLGVVELDGGDGPAASRRVADAREAVDRLRSAQAALDEREAERREREQQRKEAVARLRVCEWYAEFVRRAVPVIELRAKLEAADEHLMALGGVASRAEKGSGQLHEWLVAEALKGRLDLEAVQRLPDQASDGGQIVHDNRRPAQGQTAGLTVEDCKAWESRLDAEVERAAAALDALEA